MSKIIEEVKQKVSKLLREADSAHDMSHINRVLDLSLKFAEKEGANIETTALIALLHDIDDYKLFGEESAEKLLNANNILNSVFISDDQREVILSELKCIGYSKRLYGIKPTTIEGMIVADADMCDALGAIGIIRVNSYGIKINRPFFNPDIYPTDEEDTDHHLKGNSSTVNFIIATLLHYKNSMLTSSGKKEAKNRHNFIVNFLYQLFYEENVLKWKEYLDKYLEKLEE